MCLKCRHLGVYFLIFIITVPCCFSYYGVDQKKRANVEDYGERLSSLEHGRRGSSSELNDDNKGVVKLSGNDHKHQDDAQEEGMSLQDIPVVKFEIQKSSSKQLVTKEEDNVSPEKNSKKLQNDDKLLNTEEFTKEQVGKTLKSEEYTKEQVDKTLKSEEYTKEQVDKTLKSEEYTKEQVDKTLKSEEYTKEQVDKTLKSEEYTKEREPDKQLKSEENDVNPGEKEHANESKVDFTAEQVSNNTKLNDNANMDDPSPTKCTTDREITIGDYTPPGSHSNDEGDPHGESHGEDGGEDGGGGGGVGGETSKDVTDEGKNDIDGELKKTVSKVYKGPKPAKAPDHYIDDI